MPKLPAMRHAARPQAQAQPLAGWRIVLTRPRGQGNSLRAALVRAGARVYSCAATRITPVDDDPERDSKGWDWIVFTSANAVRAWFSARPPRPRRGSHSPWYASVGPATSRALRGYGVEPTIESAQGHGVDLAWALVERCKRGSRLLLPRSDIARPELPAILRGHGKGFLVHELVLYRTQPRPQAGKRLTAMLKRQHMDALVLSSPSAVDGIVAGVEPRALASVAIFSIGPTTTARCRYHGLDVRAEARPHTEQGLLAAMLRAASTKRGKA